MSFLDTIFSGRRIAEETIKSQKEVIIRLLDENRALNHELLNRRVETEAKSTAVPLAHSTEKGSVITGWVTPRQRVRDLISGSSPVAKAPELSQSEMEFLEQQAR